MIERCLDVIVRGESRCRVFILLYCYTTRSRERLRCDELLFIHSANKRARLASYNKEATCLEYHDTNANTLANGSRICAVWLAGTSMPSTVCVLDKQVVTMNQEDAQSRTTSSTKRPSFPRVLNTDKEQVLPGKPRHAPSKQEGS